MRSKVISISLIICLAATALAQNERAVEPPVPPFVKNAPSRAGWKIEYGAVRTNDAPKAGSPLEGQKPRRIIRVEVNKVAGTRQEITTWSDGGTSEAWFYGNWILLSHPDFPEIRVLDRTHLNEAVVKTQPDYSKGDFPALAWITGDKFAGVRTIGNRRCYVFRDGAGPDKAGSATASDEKPGQIEAAIDCGSGLPVQLRNGTTIQSYSFQESPPSSLELPPRFAAALEKYQTLLNKPYSHSMK